MTKQRSFLQGLGYPVDQTGPREEALYGVVWLADKAQREAAKALKPCGLAPATFNYLMVVKHIGRAGGLSQQEIAKRLLIHPSSVTRALDLLERKGWVTRSPGPDRRSRRITITPKGNRLLRQAWPAHQSLVRRFTRFLPEKSQRSFVETLSEWRDGLGE